MPRADRHYIFGYDWHTIDESAPCFLKRVRHKEIDSAFLWVNIPLGGIWGTGIDLLIKKQQIIQPK